MDPNHTRFDDPNLLDQEVAWNPDEISPTPPTLAPGQLVAIILTATIAPPRLHLGVVQAADLAGVRLTPHGASARLLDGLDIFIPHHTIEAVLIAPNSQDTIADVISHLAHVAALQWPDAHELPPITAEEIRAKLAEMSGDDNDEEAN